MSRLQSAAGRVPQRWSFGQWPLRRKLAAAIVLPVLLSFVFGGLRVKNDFDSSQRLSQAADTVLVIRPVVEYNLAVQRLAAAGSVGGGGVISAITKYESAAADLRIALKVDGVPDSVKANAQTALSLGQAVRTAKTQSGFSDTVIDKSGNTASLMSSAVSDLGLSDDSASAKLVVALQDAIAAQRALTGEQLNLANTDDAAASLRAVGQVGAETAALTRLLSATTSDQTGQVRQLLNENGRRGYTLQQASPDKAQLEGLGTVIESSNAAYTKLMDGQLTSLETNLRQRASQHRTSAILNAIIVIAALTAALALVLALIRSLLIPIRAVRQGALEVATKRLPEAVAAMRDGTELPAFEPIPVHTTEEMGQLARAVDDLHTQARTLAGEQARLRLQVGHMFETLSRRSTSLIDQQLSLIERLESDEEDPKRLQSLFRLDHLAARMRRNSDSLLVLAGTSTRRGMSGSVSVSDAVRAAVSEVENYERIDIGDTSNDHVLGAVGSDLIHLVAEVVDNALSYSPPTSRVAIRGARTPEGGLLIEVSDRGLGMPPKELAALNDQLAHGGDITADTARRMGLFVVGSLAKRHGIAVRLRRNGDDKQGITVSVHLPASLLADSSRGERPARPAAAPAPADAPVAASLAAPPTPAVGGTTKSGLPTRVRGASGATPSPVPGAAKKVLPTRTPGAHGPTAANGIQTPAKPVIDGADAAVEEKAPTNGHAVEDKVVNGASDKPAVNGAPAATEETVPGPQGAADAPTAAVVEAEVAEAATDSQDAPAAEAASGPQLSPSGLPVRKPRATGITEYREFEDAPSTPQEEAPTKPGAKSGAPAAKSGRLSWLPGRAKAAAEAARIEAEADEPRQMPSNLSAWLEHRAKIVEAGKARELEADAPAADGETSAQTDLVPVDAVDSDDSSDASDSSDSSDSTTEMHVPEEWVAEVASAGAADPASDLGSDDSPVAETGAEPAADGASDVPVDAPAEVSAEVSAPVDSIDVVEAPVTGSAGTTPLPTRVPGATSAHASQDPSAGATLSRPAMRAHNTSFFGARRARDAAAAAPSPEESVASAEAAATEAVTDAATEPVAVVEVATESVTDAATETVDVVEVATEAVAFQEPAVEAVAEATEESLDQSVEAAAEETTEVVASMTPEPVVAPEMAPEMAVEAVEQPRREEAVEPEGVDAQVGSPRPASLNDTPIFRAMMSRWLTDDSSVPASASWSTNEADQAWSAAARIEETQPLEESAAGLPMRRPGSYLIPGAVDEADEKPAAPAASRRDPEAIRRNLNRHKNGVSSARTEAQDGTHREEADVHH